MLSERLTEYERKCLENINRNNEQLASLNIRSKLADLSTSTKRHREQTNRPKKKAKSEILIVTRRSLRNQGEKAESIGLIDNFYKAPKKKKSPKSKVAPEKSALKLKPLSTREVSFSSKPDEPLVKRILRVSKESRSKEVNKNTGIRVRSSIDLESMKLIPENIASVVTDKILLVKFFPSADMRMIIVGNIFGELGFWKLFSISRN